MIKLIAAIDSKLGIATENGIPWDLPGDKRYFRDQTKDGIIVMGYNTYKEFNGPLPGRKNYVILKDLSEKLRPGFLGVQDLSALNEEYPDIDLWVIGGAGIFASTISLADELYLTQISANFNCSKFFPSFKQDFYLFQETKPITENHLVFRYQIWQRKQLIKR